MEAMDIILGIISVISFGVAVWQTAVVKESQKKNKEMQFLIASAYSLANQKAITWHNQLSSIDVNAERDSALVMLRARDEFYEMGSAIQALENSLTIEGSAIVDLMKKSRDVQKIAQEIQDFHKQTISEPELPSPEKQE